MWFILYFNIFLRPMKKVFAMVRLILIYRKSKPFTAYTRLVK